MAESPPGFVRGMNWTSEDARRAYEGAGTTFEAVQRDVPVAGPRVVRSVLTADHAGVANSATLVDSGLSVEVESGGVYEVRAALLGAVEADSDLKVKFVTPGGDGTGTLLEVTNAYDKAALDANIVSLFSGDASSATLGTFIGIVSFPTAGTFKIQYAQNAAAGGAATLKAGSFLTVTRLA